MKIDTATGFGKRAARRLGSETIAWLVTVDADGTPRPIPVWFLRDGETFLIYSQPGTAKLRNLARSPKAALHLDGDGQGGDIVILTGEAQAAPHTPTADRVPAYVEKYRAGLKRIGMTPASFARAYSVALRFTPTRLDGH